MPGRRATARAIPRASSYICSMPPMNKFPCSTASLPPTSMTLRKVSSCRLSGGRPTSSTRVTAITTGGPISMRSMPASSPASNTTLPCALKPHGPSLRQIAAADRDTILEDQIVRFTYRHQGGGRRNRYEKPLRRIVVARPDKARPLILATNDCLGTTNWFNG
jgi:hypothetical protein